MAVLMTLILIMEMEEVWWINFVTFQLLLLFFYFTKASVLIVLKVLRVLKVLKVMKQQIMEQQVSTGLKVKVIFLIGNINFLKILQRSLCVIYFTTYIREFNLASQLIIWMFKRFIRMLQKIQIASRWWRCQRGFRRFWRLYTNRCCRRSISFTISFHNHGEGPH